MTSLPQTTPVIITDDLKQAISEAARWYSCFSGGFSTGFDESSEPSLNSENTSKAARLAWQKWLEESPLNQQAWTQVELVQAQFGAQPANLLSPALKAVDSSRRELLQRLSLLVFVVPLGGLSYRYLPWQHWQADYSTNLGERQDIQLIDGTLLVLDTNTVIDVHYDDKQRLITLHSGRIMITTAKDSTARQFSVNTPQGRVIALGTRFSVASYNGTTQVAVFEKSVQVYNKTIHHNKRQKSQIISQGQSISFASNNLGDINHVEPFADAWLQNYLVVVNITLIDLLTQLARYRLGILRCSDDIAQLKISGSFPLDDTDRSLFILEQTFPLRQRRLTRYWVSIEATNSG
jgi:transmembrane sensor